MTKMTDFDKINYVAATFPVDSATQAYLKANHLASTGNVDVNNKKLAVKLNADGTVGFGTGAATDKLLGIIMAYEMDGFASVQIEGGVDLVPAAAALTAGFKGLAVNEKGEIVEVSGAREVRVVKQATSDKLFASIVL